MKNAHTSMSAKFLGDRLIRKWPVNCLNTSVPRDTYNYSLTSGTDIQPSCIQTFQIAGVSPISLILFSHLAAFPSVSNMSAKRDRTALSYLRPEKMNVKYTFCIDCNKYGSNLECSSVSSGIRPQDWLSKFSVDSDILLTAPRDNSDQLCLISFLTSFYVASVVNFLGFPAYLWKMPSS